MKTLIILAGASSLMMGAAQAATIFQASDSNTTKISNNNNAGDSFAKVAVSGDTATSTLLISNTNGSFGNGGIASTDDINTLNTVGLTALDTVTMAFTVDSINGPIRSNGVTFGLDSDAVFGPDLGVNIRANNATTTLTSSFGAPDPITAWSANQASILDGFSVMFTADVNGYAFSFTNLIAQGVNPIVDITGTFSGTEFVDNFGGGHFYATAQKFNQGATALDTTISVASIDVTSVPEPSSALLGLAGLGCFMRRKR